MMFAHLGASELSRLVEQRVGERCLAVVDVRNDGHIPRVPRRACVGVDGHIGGVVHACDRHGGWLEWMLIAKREMVLRSACTVW